MRAPQEAALTLERVHVGGACREQSEEEGEGVKLAPDLELGMDERRVGEVSPADSNAWARASRRRTKARTGYPAASSSVTTGVPVRPAAPVTRTRGFNIGVPFPVMLWPISVDTRFDSRKAQ